MMILLGYSLFDLRGSLPKIDAASSQTISADGVQAIDIHAEGVAVEVGSSYDIGQIQVQLYGTGYVTKKRYGSWMITARCPFGWIPIR